MEICRVSIYRGFTAEASLELLDGQVLRFSEIKPRLLMKEKLWTLGVNHSNEICASQIIDTQTTASTKAIEIEMDYGCKIICGNDQEFFLRDFTGRKAADLRIGDPILRVNLKSAGRATTRAARCALLTWSAGSSSIRAVTWFIRGLSMNCPPQ